MKKQDNSRCATLKPLSGQVDILEMRRLMGSWRMAGLSPQQMLKMMRLYLGETGWMNTQGEYPSGNFYEIAVGLKFRTISNLVACLGRCGGFGFVWRSEQHTAANLVAFFSSLWHAPAKEERVEYAIVGASGRGATPATDAGLQRMQRDNILYNNYIDINNKEYYHAATVAGAADAGKTTDAGKAAEAGIAQATARQMFADFEQRLFSDPGAYEAIVAPINRQTEQLMPELHVEQCPVNLATRRFVEKYLADYFISRGQRFVGSSYEGRKIWLTNLMRFPFMQANVRRAVADIREQTAHNRMMLVRLNRPISPFEYQDRGTGQRFYDIADISGASAPSSEKAPSSGKDPSSGCESEHTIVRRIPRDAPPRPSALARWDKFDHRWVEFA